MSKFPTVNLVSSESGATVSGELVVETVTAYQVAVDGKVRLLKKSEWNGAASVSDVFGQFFGGAR